MNGDGLKNLITQIGLPGALLAFMLHAYVKLTSAIIPMLQDINIKLERLISLIEALVRNIKP